MKPGKLPDIIIYTIISLQKKKLATFAGVTILVNDWLMLPVRVNKQGP